MSAISIHTVSIYVAMSAVSIYERYKYTCCEYVWP